MRKRLLHVPRKARCKNVFVRSELMTRLSDDRVDDIKTRDLVFWFALENKLFDVLHYVLVELYRLHRCLGD